MLNVHVENGLEFKIYIFFKLKSKLFHYLCINLAQEKVFLDISV